MDDAIRRLPKNALYNAAAAFVPVVVALVSTPYILSRLGNEAFGLYLVALSVASFAGLLDLGLGTASIKFVSEHRARGDWAGLSRLINSLLIARLPQALAVAGLGFLGAATICSRVLAVPPPLIPEAVFIVRVSVVTLSVALVGGSLAALPRALHRFDIASRVGTLHGLLLTAGTVALLALGHALREIVLFELLLGVLSLAISAIVARKLLPEWRPELRFSRDSLQRLLGFGSLTTLNSLAGFVFLHVNRILVGRVQGVASVPFFAIPWSLCLRVTQLTSALTEAMAPVASALSAGKGEAHLRTLYSRTTSLTAVVAGSFLVPLGVGAGDLLVLWLGAEFGDHGGPVLRVLTVAAFVQSLSAVPYFLLTGLGRPGAANAPTLAAATLNVVLAMFLLPLYGLIGVAVAILIGLTAQTLILVHAVEKALNVSGSGIRALRSPVASAVVGAAAGMAVVSRLDETILRLTLSCAATALCQHTLLIATGCYGLRELRLIRAALRPGSGSETLPARGDN